MVSRLGNMDSDGAMALAAEKLERLLEKEEWVRAEGVAREAVLASPLSHWLAFRLADAIYEQRRYREALGQYRKAERLEPTCPMVLWGIGGCLDALGRPRAAAKYFGKIVSRGVGGLERGNCTEGIRHSRGLVTDAWFRLAQIDERAGRNVRALQLYQRALDLQRSGDMNLHSNAEIRARKQSAQGGLARPQEGKRAHRKAPKRSE